MFAMMYQEPFVSSSICCLSKETEKAKCIFIHWQSSSFHDSFSIGVHYVYRRKLDMHSTIYLLFYENLEGKVSAYAQISCPF